MAGELLSLSPGNCTALLYKNGPSRLNYPKEDNDSEMCPEGGLLSS